MLINNSLRLDNIAAFVWQFLLTPVVQKVNRHRTSLERMVGGMSKLVGSVLP